MKYLIIPIFRLIFVIIFVLFRQPFMGLIYILSYFWSLDKQMLYEYKDLVKRELFEEFLSSDSNVLGQTDYYYRTPLDYILNKKTFNK